MTDGHEARMVAGNRSAEAIGHMDDETVERMDALALVTFETLRYLVEAKGVHPRMATQMILGGVTGVLFDIVIPDPPDQATTPTP